jgi:hypothetical protein
VKKLLFVAALISPTGPVFAQSAPPAADPVKIELSRASLAAIASGIMKLPYEMAAPLLNDLQRQLDAQTPKAAAPAPAPDAKPADKAEDAAAKK